MMPTLSVHVGDQQASLAQSSPRTEHYRITSTSAPSGADMRRVSFYHIATLRETLLLNSWAKFVLFKRFPTGCIIDFFLLVMITLQVGYYYHYDVRRASSVLTHFSSLLTGVEGTFEKRHIVLQTPSAVNAHVAQTLQNGDRVNELSITNYTITQYWNVDFAYRNGTRTGKSLNRTQCSTPAAIAHALPELFDPAHLSTLAKFDLSLALNDRFIVHANHYGCWDWHLSDNCDGEGGGHFVCTLNYVITDCAAQTFSVWVSHLLVFSCATLGLIRLVQKAKRTIDLVRILQANSPTWQKCTMSEKLSIINQWWPFAVVTNVVMIVVAIQSTLAHENVSTRLRGVGCSIFFSYINIIQYFSHQRSCRVLFSTLHRAIPQVATFLLCVFPIVCGFAFLGVMFFWSVHWFSTPSMAFCNLFSLLNGDVLHDNFLNLKDVSATFSQVYLYLFLSFFIYVVLNVNITIIGEAFLQAHRCEHQLNGFAQRTHDTPSDAGFSAVHSFQDRHFASLAPAMIRALEEISPIVRRDDRSHPATPMAPTVASNLLETPEEHLQRVVTSSEEVLHSYLSERITQRESLCEARDSEGVMPLIPDTSQKLEPSVLSHLTAAPETWVLRRRVATLLLSGVAVSTVTPFMDELARLER